MSTSIREMLMTNTLILANASLLMQMFQKHPYQLETRCFPPRTEGTLYDIIPSHTTMLCKDHQYPLFFEGSQVSRVCLVTPTFRSRAQSMCSAAALYSLGYTGSSVRCVSWSQHQPGCPAFSIAMAQSF